MPTIAERSMTHSSQWHSSQKMRTRLLSESCLNTSATVWKLPIVSTDSCSSRIVPSSLCWCGKCTSLIVVPPFFLGLRARPYPVWKFVSPERKRHACSP